MPGLLPARVEASPGASRRRRPARLRLPPAWRRIREFSWLSPLCRRSGAGDAAVLVFQHLDQAVYAGAVDGLREGAAIGGDEAEVFHQHVVDLPASRGVGRST